MKARDFVFVRRDGSSPALALAAIFILLLLICSAICVLVFQSVDYAWNWEGVGEYWKLFLNGWLVTVALSFASLIVSLLIGTAAALASQSRFLPLRCLPTLYVELIRGTPLLVQIMILFYGVFAAVHFENRYIAGVLILSLFSGAYVTEIIRSGIQSIGKSQWESALAVGFTSTQAYRFVIFPQAVRVLLPPLAGELVSLIKNSSLLSIIAVNELTLNARNVASFSYSSFESYLPLAVGYLILTLPISLWARWLERRVRFDT